MEKIVDLVHWFSTKNNDDVDENAINAKGF